MIKRAIKSSVKQDINGCESKSLCFSFCDENETNMSPIRASLVTRRYGNIDVLEYSSENPVDLLEVNDTRLFALTLVSKLCCRLMEILILSGLNHSTQEESMTNSLA